MSEMTHLHNPINLRYSARKEFKTSEQRGIRTRQTCGFFTSGQYAYGREGGRDTTPARGSLPTDAARVLTSRPPAFRLRSIRLRPEQNMTTLTLGNTAVRQLDGLYSLNDLHKAAGGDDKHQPALFMRNDQAQELIAEIKSTDLQICVKTVRGGHGGTYVCRELVYAYAAWISAAFYLTMIRAFDALGVAPRVGAGKTAVDVKPALPAGNPIISPALRTHINRTAHQIALKQYDTIHSILTDCAADNLACGAKEADCFDTVDAYADTADGTALVNVRDLKELVWNTEQVINTAASAIAAIHAIEKRSGLSLALRLKRSTSTPADWHKNDRLVQEVLARMNGESA